MAESKSKNKNFLEYKGKPLVRCKNTIYYGNMSDPFVICLNVIDSNSEESTDELTISGKVTVQLLKTDPDLSPKEKIVKKSEKNGIFNALDLGAVWLERALK